MQLFTHLGPITKLLCNNLAGDALEQTAHTREAAHMPHTTSVTRGAQQ